jgi:hypothetical protein
LNNALKKTTIGDNDADLAPRVFGFAALGVMAAMFALMGFSMTIIIFLVLVGYFVWRAVAKTEMHEIRGIFEFYLAANEVLRDDERRWYGFEIQDVIARGQRVLSMMPDPPPLVHFALGALHHRAGNFQQAENHLAFLVENDKSDEISRLSATSELRSYVRILRKLEREPAEAPQTTAAIRALERARRHRAAVLLAESRSKSQEAIAAAKLKEIAEAAPVKEPRKPLLERLEEKTPESAVTASSESQKVQHFTSFNLNDEVKHSTNGDAVKRGESQNGTAEPTKKARSPKKEKIQKSITEVLRDIYD